MMNIFKKLPKKLVVAVSGGSDSMACLHYFVERGFDVSIAHYVHGFSAFSNQELEFVSDVAAKLKLAIHVGIQDECMLGKSKEEFWRNGRYSFFKKFDCPVVTGHTLDDAVEWYVYAALNGRIDLLPYSNQNVVRPFLLYKKNDLVSFLTERNLQWLEDPSNAQIDFAKRNLVRSSVLPKALEVNPGLHNMVKRMLVKKYK